MVAEGVDMYRDALVDILSNYGNYGCFENDPKTLISKNVISHSCCKPRLLTNSSGTIIVI